MLLNVLKIALRKKFPNFSEHIFGFEKFVPFMKEMKKMGFIRDIFQKGFLICKRKEKRKRTEEGEMREKGV